ncbi:hypothetical protein ACFQ0K_13035 [Nocardioides caeni]|uniref:Uncharacterized protein n=1 Tax=Nocardioides caeni TaxID=574700 RepID=A0A4S8NKT1_9ACTN|nr:hypothetical protein [Nocardioides caeni]THV17663.1 hypothetical protein E9934_04070 [Nocardioides caeni]
MSNGTDDSQQAGERESAVGISDDQLPDELVPSDDNPLAEGLPDGETVDGLLTEKKPGLSSEDDPSDDAPADDTP